MAPVLKLGVLSPPIQMCSAATAAAAKSNEKNSLNFSSGSQTETKEVNKNRRKKVMTNGVTTPAAPKSSPLRSAEETASRFGLEMTIAALERLFHTDPPAAAPSPGRRLRVAYQGVRGSYCHEAAARAFPSANDAFPCAHTMDDAFSALDDGSADRAVVPAENSLDGPIHRNLDLLLRHPSVRIAGELVLPVRHSLLGLPGAPISALRRVVSHPQALAHCQEGLQALGLHVEEVPDAAEAAQFVAENRLADTAVIGSGIAAREFGLRVLERDFQDPGRNFTRFLQLGLGRTLSLGGVGGGGGGGGWKTTVAFALEDGASGLFRALWAFESRGVRVDRVDHRPNRSQPIRVVEGAARLDYVFVADIQGSEEDPRVAAALARLAEDAAFLRVLGSYTCSYGRLIAS